MPVERLRKHELFELLNPKEMERLSNASGVVRLKEGERVYSEGNPASHLFVLVTGRVELRRPARGGLSLLVDDIAEHGIFGVSSLMGGERYLLNAECVKDSELVKIEGAVLRRILSDNPVVGFAVQSRVSQIFFKRYVETMARLEALTRALPLRAA